MAQPVSLLGEQATGEWNEQICGVFLHQRKHQFWWSTILVTGITKTSLHACNSLSIPVVYTDLSVPRGAVLMPLKNGQNQQDAWSARSSNGCSLSVFVSGVYTSSEEGFCIFVFPAGPGSCHLHSLLRLLFLFFCSPSFFSQISSLASIIIVGSGRMNDLSHLIQWHKYETFIIYSARCLLKTNSPVTHASR